MTSARLGTARRRALRTLGAISLALTVALPMAQAIATSTTTRSTPAQVWFDQPGVADGSVGIATVESRAIVNAQPGSLLVMSVFRITAERFALRLVEAAVRGVHVEVLVNGGNDCTKASGCPHPSIRDLRRLNHLHDPLSWLRTCDGGTPANNDVATSSGRGCIGQTLDHNKFFAFSDTQLPGQTVAPLVIQTSTNNTTSQYRHAWNDALLLNDQTAVYEDYLHYFRVMARAASSSRPTAKMYFTARNGTSIDTTTIAQHDIETWSFPRAPSDDPVASVLQRILLTRRCANRVATGSTGPSHTHVYAAVAFVGGRPLLMKQLMTLQNSGCNVQLIYTTISSKDLRELTASGVQVFQACTPADPADDETLQFLHSKFFLVDGSDSSVGSNRRLVYTGSENWNAQSLSEADNRMVRYVEPADPSAASTTSPGSPLFDAYLGRWMQLRNIAETNGQPTADSCHGATDY